MEWKEGELEGEPHGEEGERRLDRVGAGHGGQPRRQIGHVEGAGHHVHEADPDDVERGSEGAHDQIAIGGGERAPAGTQGDQHIRRQRGDLEEDEQVEDVAGDGDAEQPREAQQVHGVKQIDAVPFHLVLDARAGERHDDRADGGDDDDDEGAHPVDPVLDSPRRGPAPERIGHCPGLEHADQKEDRHRERRPASGERQRPRQPWVAEDQA